MAGYNRARLNLAQPAAAVGMLSFVVRDYHSTSILQFHNNKNA
jgi:hypothetical protein